MRTKIEWAEVHAPLFIAGTNLQQKLDPKKRTGLAMEYDEVQRHLYVTWNGQTARIPETSVLTMIEASTAPSLKQRIAVGQQHMESNIVDQVQTFMRGSHGPSGPIPALRPAGMDAQVETPMSHVHAGLGAGQTGQEPPKERKKPGPKPKPKA